MNMSNINSTRKSSYSHLSATERGEIAAYLKMGKKPVEIARLQGCHRSTICREIKRGSVEQRMENKPSSTPISLIVDNVSTKLIVKRVLTSS